jgi:hypothetical protein
MSRDSRYPYAGGRGPGGTGWNHMNALEKGDLNQRTADMITVRQRSAEQLKAMNEPRPRIKEQRNPENMGTNPDNYLIKRSVSWDEVAVGLSGQDRVYGNPRYPKSV